MQRKPWARVMKLSWKKLGSHYKIARLPFKAEGDNHMGTRGAGLHKDQEGHAQQPLVRSDREEPYA